MISIKKLMYITYTILAIHNANIIQAAIPRFEKPRDFYTNIQKKLELYYNALEHITQKTKKTAYNYEQEIQYVKAQLDLIQIYIKEIDQINNDLTQNFVPIFKRDPEHNEEYTDRRQFEQKVYPLRIQIQTLTEQFTQLSNDMINLLDITTAINAIPLIFHGSQQSQIIQKAQNNLEWITLHFSEKNNIIQRLERKITKLIKIKLIQSCGAQITKPEEEKPMLNFLHELDGYKSWLTIHQNESTKTILDMLRTCIKQAEKSLQNFILFHIKAIHKEFLHIKEWQSMFNKKNLEISIKDVSTNIAWLKQHNTNQNTLNLIQNNEKLLSDLHKSLQEKIEQEQKEESVKIKKQPFKIRPKTSTNNATTQIPYESSDIQSDQPLLPKIKTKKPLRLRPKEQSNLTEEQFDISQEPILLPAILSQEVQALVPTRPKTHQNVSLPKTSRLTQARYSQPQLDTNSTVTETILHDIDPYTTEQKS